MSSPRDRLGAVLTQHKQFLTQVQACIAADVSAVNNDQYEQFLLLLSRRIEVHQMRLQAAEQNQHSEDDLVQWGAIEAIREPRDGSGLVFNIHGPATGDEQTVTVESEDAAVHLDDQLRQYDKMSKALARANSQELAIVELRKAGGGSTKQQPPADKDQTRITLLKQYNDLRDVAQEFIGIIADNRRVPVRSLYADGNFGVGPED